MDGLARWLAAGTRFSYRGRSIFGREFLSGLGSGLGSGSISDSTLVLVHGFPTSSFDWHRVWDALCARHRRVIALDMIGFGWSDKPRDYAYSIRDQADLHEAVLRSLGVEAFHVLAHDYGDTVAQELLARHDERAPDERAAFGIASMCFLNGGLFPETHRPRLVQRLLDSPLGFLLARAVNKRAFERSFVPIFGKKTRPTQAELDAFWSLVSHDDGQHLFHKLIGYMRERRVHRARWVGALTHTDVPLRVIDGADDPISGAHMVARYRELVPNPDCVLLPGIGHYPQLEDPEGVLRAYFEFREARTS